MELAMIVLLLGLMALSIFRKAVLIFMAIMALSVGLIFDESSSIWVSIAATVILLWAGLAMIKTWGGSYE